MDPRDGKFWFGVAVGATMALGWMKAITIQDSVPKKRDDLKPNTAMFPKGDSSGPSNALQATYQPPITPVDKKKPLADDRLHPFADDGPLASGRLGCVRVLSDLDRKNVLDSGCLEGGDVATCAGLPKVNAESVRVLSDLDRRNVLDPGNLDGGDAATCPGVLCLGPGPLQLGLTYYGLSFAPHSLMRVYPDGGVE
ncbi:hypothetical protein AgCh_017576 [Apium graveolens]